MTPSAPGSTGSPAPASPGAPALDELMLAMDVVDTLRHQEDVALRELAQDGRDAGLKERLRQLYESQGLTVSERILDEGLQALRESRFAYTPTPPGVSRTLAGLWVRRALLGSVVAVFVVVGGLAGGWLHWRQLAADRAAEAARIELTATLPEALAATGGAALAEATTAAARERVAQLQADGALALSQGDATAARVALAGLERVRADLGQTYTLRIVSRPGASSGVYRIPDANTGARNYYLVVEAVTADGRTLSRPVRNEETGRTETVSTWGVRVPAATWEAVRRDKSDDGILQNDILAVKPRGALEPVYRMAVSGGAITQW
ncbi:DUF6384 family protein [Segnochrobactraceae bacterium EtOH-i3]